MAAPRICFFGDSFTNGTGDDDALGWVGRLSAATRRDGVDLTSYNLGVRRDAALDIRLRWRAEANARLPDEFDGRLVFSFGTNDTSSMQPNGPSRFSMEETVTHAAIILGEAAKWRPTLMIAALPVMADAVQNVRLTALAKGLAHIAASTGARYLDLTDVCSPLLPVWREEAEEGDGVHPGRGGYAALADMIGASAEWRAFIA